MNDTTQPDNSPLGRLARPSDPAMAASDPAMFAPLTRDENSITRAHLASGWAKQGAVYPVLSEPWKETSVVLTDLHHAWNARFDAEHQAEAEAEAGT